MDNVYISGNKMLLRILRKKPFPKQMAKWLLRKIPDLNQPILDRNGYSTTYLYEAQSENNPEAVKLLLAGGANPNYENSNLVSSCALWDLQYPWSDEDDVLLRYEIAKLFFEYGANPNLISEGECLRENVCMIGL